MKYNCNSKISGSSIRNQLSGGLQMYQGVERSQDAAVMGDSPSGPKPKRARRTAPKQSTSDGPETQPRAPKPKASRRGRSNAAAVDNAEASTSACTELAELPSNWNGLPQILLTTIFAWLSNEDVISAGQSCFGWREAAKLPTVWMGRSLTYDVPPSTGKVEKDKHEGAKVFARTMRFAPNLLFVSCPKSMKPAARAAMTTQPICKVKSAVLNGSLKWTVKYLQRQRESLEGLTLISPTLEVLRAVMTLPKLTSFVTTDLNYQWSELPYNGLNEEPAISGYSATTGTLQRLVCHPGLELQACTAFVEANAATLEEVAVCCFPAQALERCTLLRRLLVTIDPAAAAQAQLRQLLKARAPLDFVGFICTDHHSKAPCVALRESLQDCVRDGGAILCDRCNMACPLNRRPRAAPMSLRPESVFDEILASEFNLGDPCHCFVCSSSDDETSIEEGSFGEEASDEEFLDSFEEEVSDEEFLDSYEDSFEEGSDEDFDGPAGCLVQ
ncbi:uncharacterized protein LOC117639540 isoform X2 [Thrips palmi]|uniref:Uncharacterized protein LOC117639540 isoform X2 n=1 Tax=Thrips palmi TaxID=161013 RepID=A0A6P8ZH41_THRPL|nr:uncharacterized protein LOC117639540 isoform X2 [Thrips palmi]